MADLIPPVPNTNFQTSPQIFTWKDWFRRLRENVNAFAAEIASIIVQITSIQDAGTGVLGSTNYTTVNTVIVNDVVDATINPSGNYEVLIQGYVSGTFSDTSLTGSYGVVNIVLEENGSTIKTTAVKIYYFAPMETTLNSFSFDIPIGYLYTPTSGSKTYSLTLQTVFRDTAGSLIALTGSYIVDSFLYVKEVKT